MMTGGLGDEKEMTNDVKELTIALKSEAEKSLNETFSKFEPLSFKSQVVAGVNYFVKVDIGNGNIILRIYKPLPHTNEQPSLSSLKKISNDEEITYF